MQNICSILRVSKLRNDVTAIPVIQYRWLKQRIRSRDSQEQKHKTKEKRTRIQLKKSRPFIFKDYSSGLSSKERLEFESRVPEDDVWFVKQYPVVQYTVREAVSRHAEAAQPAMFNNPTGIIQMKGLLDMRTKKKTKFLPPYNGVIRFPNDFGAGSSRRIGVFSASESDCLVAEKLGATIAGGQNLIDLVLSNEIRPFEYDFFACTPDIFKAITPLKPRLKEKFPDITKGTVNGDIGAMLSYLLNCKTFDVSRDPVNDADGFFTAPVGTIDLGAERVAENVAALVGQLCSKRHSDLHRQLGPFVKKAILVCPPSPEQFHVSVEEFLPSPNENRPPGKTVSDNAEPAQAAAGN